MHERRLVLGAAERGPLHRRRLGVKRVELDHPAEAVGLVGIGGGDDEALVVRGPVVAVPADAVGRLKPGVLRLVRLLGPVDAEVAVEVLLTGQVGVPRGVAVRTVVDGSQQRTGGGIGRRLQQPVTGRGPGYGHRRVGRDPPVAGRAHGLPGAAGAACHFDDADTVRVLGLEHHLRRPLSFGRHGRRARVQVALVGVLHVDHEQTATAASPFVSEREVMHAVVVHADLLCLLRGGVTARDQGRSSGHERREGAEDRRAPGDQRPRGVPRRHHDLVGVAGRNCREAEQQGGPARVRSLARMLRRRRRSPESRGQEPRRRRHPARDHGTSGDARVDQLVHVRRIRLRLDAELALVCYRHQDLQIARRTGHDTRPGSPELCPRPVTRM